MGEPDQEQVSSFPIGSLGLSTDEQSGAVVLAVAGEVDVLTAPQLRTALDDLLVRLGDRALVLDLSGVTFFGSSGLQVLTFAATRMREPDGSSGLRVVAAYAARRPIQLTGLDALVTLYDTAEAALEG